MEKKNASIYKERESQLKELKLTQKDPKVAGCKEKVYQKLLNVFLSKWVNHFRQQ